MKRQISNRLGIAHVRDTVEQFCDRKITMEQACADLDIGKTRLYRLREQFLRAKATGNAESWAPGLSGGNRADPWPEEVVRFLRKVLKPAGDVSPYTYAFAASEIERIFNRTLDRAQVRKWAIANGVAAPSYEPRPPAHKRRWQRQSVGELWQIDATPDHFFGKGNPSVSLIDMLDDCSRMQVGCSLYHSENVPAYIHLFHHAFTRYGLPLQIYSDKAGFFRNESGSLTQLGMRLKFYDISLVFANTPEAKGKIERIHQVWQQRLPGYFYQNGITIDTPLEVVNEHIERLVDHRNGFEMHRDIGMRPKDAWDRAIEAGHNKLRAIPDDGWWELVWSVWSGIQVGPRGRVNVDNHVCPTECANGTWVYLCRHVDGSFSLVLKKPVHGERPIVLYTTNAHIHIPR